VVVSKVNPWERSICTGESSVDPTDLSFEWIERCEYVRQSSEGMEEDQGTTWYI